MKPREVIFFRSFFNKALYLFVLTFLLIPITSFSDDGNPNDTENKRLAYVISSNSWSGDKDEPGIDEYKKIVQKCKEVGNDFCEAAAKYNIGTILYNKQDYKQALGYYKDSLSKFETLKDYKNMKLVLYNLIASLINHYSSMNCVEETSIGEGLIYSELLLNISIKTYDKENELAAYNFTAIISLLTRDYYLALENYENILAYFVSERIVEGKGNILNNIAAIYYHIGDYKNALDYLQRAMVVYMINGKEDKVSDIKNNIAIIYAETGDYENAQLNLEVLEDTIKGGVDDCTLFNNLGVIYSELCEFEKALKYYNKSLKQAENQHREVQVAKNLKDIGSVYEEIGDYEHAIDYYRKSLSMSNDFNDFNSIMALNLSLGDIYAKSEIYSVALVHYEEALDMARELKEMKMEAYSLLSIGNIHSHKADYKKSLDYYYESFNLYRGLGLKKGQGLALVNISNIHNNLHNYEKGEKYAKRAIKIFDDIQYFKHLKAAYLALSDSYKGQKDLVNAELYMTKASEYDFLCGS